jgi:hypothetical protein
MPPTYFWRLIRIVNCVWESATASVYNWARSYDVNGPKHRI